jgi:hypothetical protein
MPQVPSELRVHRHDHLKVYSGFVLSLLLLFVLLCLGNVYIILH